MVRISFVDNKIGFCHSNSLLFELFGSCLLKSNNLSKQLNELLVYEFLDVPDD